MRMMMIMVKLFTFIGVIVLALQAHALNSELPAPTIYKMNSVFSQQRSSFDAFYYSAKNSKGTIVYIYGGGCQFPASEKSLEINEIGKKIIENGYSLYIPHYRQLLDWDTGNIPSQRVEHECREATLNEIVDIKTSINFLFEKLGQKNIYIWGHSFGAFLVNILALERPRIPAVKGFISSNGWWDVSVDYWGLWRLSPTSMAPILKEPDSLSRILIVHTVDDERIPFSQIGAFRTWIDQAKRKPDYKLVVFPTGGHTYLRKLDYPSDIFLNELLDFVK